MSEFFKQRKELRKHVQMFVDDCMTERHLKMFDLHGQVDEQIRSESVPYFTSYPAKQFLGLDAFDAIQFIKEHELSNFGIIQTDLTCHISVANMLAYLLTIEIVNDEYMDKINQMIHDYQQEEEEEVMA